MDIEKKIRKLLALSESPNEFEAQAVHERAKHSKTYFIGFVGLEEDVSICVNVFCICSGLRFNTDKKFETDIL